MWVKVVTTALCPVCIQFMQFALQHENNRNQLLTCAGITQFLQRAAMLALQALH